MLFLLGMVFLIFLVFMIVHLAMFRLVEVPRMTFVYICHITGGFCVLWSLPRIFVYIGYYGRALRTLAITEDFCVSWPLRMTFAYVGDGGRSSPNCPNTFYVTPFQIVWQTGKFFRFSAVCCCLVIWLEPNIIPLQFQIAGWSRMSYVVGNQ